MIQIFYTSDDCTEDFQGWSLGDAMRCSPHKITRIYVDGCELDRIREDFGTTVPISSVAHIQSWHGDTAKSIMYCLSQIH